MTIAPVQQIMRARRNGGLPGSRAAARKILAELLSCLAEGELSRAAVIPWSSPVLSFGSLFNSRVATIGINPSNREFVDDEGAELDGTERRFHTLKSFGLRHWSQVDDRHMDLLLDSCDTYFQRNPYNGWFKRLDRIISGTNHSYYGDVKQACHLDLVPFATRCKWTDLSRMQRSTLLHISGDTLATLIRESSIEILILNGSSVVSAFQEMSGHDLESRTRPAWALPRTSRPVAGISYEGILDRLASRPLGRQILVMGYNHNIQSSFGVTARVMDAIGRWIQDMAATVSA